MKSGAKIQISDCGFLTLTLAFGLCALPVLGVVTDNPYRPIVDRNVFALKPPTPVVNTLAQPPTPPAGVELRGISTLLGRPQVLLNIKVPAKPPEQPKDRSLVLDVGQREGEVEVLEINAANGSVRLRNQGTELTMNLKDNAAKPQSIAVAAPGGAPAALPGIPPPPPSMGRPSLPNPGGANNPVLGNSPSNPGAASLPTRSLRASPQNATPVAGGFKDAAEQAAAIEVMAEADKDRIQAGQIPPPPFTGVRRRE